MPAVLHHCLSASLTSAPLPLHLLHHHHQHGKVSPMAAFHLLLCMFLIPFLKKQVILGFGVIQIRTHVLVALLNKIDYEYGNWDYKSKESTGSWGNKESESTESWGDKESELWLEKGELRSLRARGDHSSCHSESGLEPPQLSLLSLLPQLQEHPPSFLMW